MISQHGVSLWTQTICFEVIPAQPTSFVFLEMHCNCFDIRLFHVLGATRMFEGARINQAFSALACKVNANFILHTRREGVRVGAIRIGEIEHSHLLLDKPCFLGGGRRAPRLLSRISRAGVSDLGEGQFPLVLTLLLNRSRRSTNDFACRWAGNTSRNLESRYKLTWDDRRDSLRLGPCDLFLQGREDPQRLLDLR